MEGRTTPNKSRPRQSLACNNTGSIEQIAPDGSETTLITGAKPDGR
jgi:hypothetical protein